MSEEINCPECGHSINGHNPCWPKGFLCDQIRDSMCACELSPQDIAAHHIAQAYEQARIDHGVKNAESFLLCVDKCLTDPAHIAVAESS